jgi:hypothetical protein
VSACFLMISQNTIQWLAQPSPLWIPIHQAITHKELVEPYFRHVSSHVIMFVPRIESTCVIVTRPEKRQIP